MQAAIEERPPVVAGAEIEIAADPASVWDVLVGTRFHWKAGPGTITSTMRELERPERVVWTGRTLGIKALHTWKLGSENGRTRVTTEETYSGIPARLFRRSLTRMLARSLENGLERLKETVEGRAR